jgi:DHA2 family multidrug resistance protein-like MFS transporter
MVVRDKSPFGVIALLLTLRVVPVHRGIIRGRFDVAGALFSAIMLGAVIMASNAFSRPGEAGARY